LGSETPKHDEKFFTETGKIGAFSLKEKIVVSFFATTPFPKRSPDRATRKGSIASISFPFGFREISRWLMVTERKGGGEGRGAGTGVISG
jgi:hypothetical protein